MFGYGFNDQKEFRIYFPERIDADLVAQMAGDQDDLVRDVKRIRFAEMLPGREIPNGKEQALHITLVDKRRHNELPQRLEPLFNPLARSWQANYVGSCIDNANKHFYTIAEGDSSELRTFLSIRPVTVGALSVISQLNFGIEGPDAAQIVEALPNDFVLSLSN